MPTEGHYQDVDDWELVEETHQFAEWQNHFPAGSSSSYQIPWEDALTAQGKAEVIEEAASDERTSKLFDKIFGR